MERKFTPSIQTRQSESQSKKVFLKGGAVTQQIEKSAGAIAPYLYLSLHIDL